MSVNPVLTKTLERIDELFNATDSITGVTTGFKDLDEMTSGLQPSDLVMVAARPSMGNTAFAMNLVEAALIKAETRMVLEQQLQHAVAGIRIGMPRSGLELNHHHRPVMNAAT